MKSYIISKANYLSKPLISEFVEYLSLILTNKESLNLTFSVPKQNKEYPSDYWTNNSNRIVNYEFFDDSLTEYFWARETLEENKERLDKISSQFKDAESAVSDPLFYKAVDDCLLWGAGYRKTASLYKNNIAWLREHFPNKVGVVSYFVETLGAMQEEQVDLHSFPSMFKMNSGYTKVYALMAPSKFIIYDSRVAAGLGLLFIKFIREKTSYTGELKDVLGIRFLKQGVKPRDPNFIMNIGMKAIYPSTTNSSLNHAKSNILANWLLQAVDEKLRHQMAEPNIDLRKMEAGLFMLGSQVGRPHGPMVE